MGFPEGGLRGFFSGLHEPTGTTAHSNTEFLSVTHLLDTNIAIGLIKNVPQIFDHLSRLNLDDVAISAITEAELRYGAEKSAQPARNHAALDRFLIAIPSKPFDSACVREYGKIRAALEKKGTPIGSMDTLIAAHALALRVTLVTSNTKEFQRVPGLVLENWSRR